MKKLAIICVTVALTSCETTPEAGELFQTVSDVAVQRLINGTDPAPEPRTDLAFTDDEAFDRQMWSSLRNASVPNGSVRVTLPARSKDAPARLLTWVRKVSDAGGQVQTCDVASNESTVVAVWEIARIAWRELSPIARRYAIYQPATGYNAVFETSAGSEEIRGVRFVSKSSDYARYVQRYAGCTRS